MLLIQKQQLFYMNIDHSIRLWSTEECPKSEEKIMEKVEGPAGLDLTAALRLSWD
jgi:hypothetical protein